MIVGVEAGNGYPYLHRKAAALLNPFTIPARIQPNGVPVIRLFATGGGAHPLWLPGCAGCCWVLPPFSRKKLDVDDADDSLRLSVSPVTLSVALPASIQRNCGAVKRADRTFRTSGCSGGRLHLALILLLREDKRYVIIAIGQGRASFDCFAARLH